jgi:hypothetical protein
LKYYRENIHFILPAVPFCVVGLFPPFLSLRWRANSF